MRVALLGGTGFVGGYLVDALIEDGLQPALLVRPGSGDRVHRGAECRLVEGDARNDDDVERLLGEAEAVIYNIGILREYPLRGITFDEMHTGAPRRVIDTARRLGIRRFLLMSANGVKPGGTAYQRSKYRAEEYLADSGLDWTVLRPSVIFGDPRGKMEFATQLLRDVIRSPLPAPLFFPGLSPLQAGRFQLTPVHVEDVARGFASALPQQGTHGRVLHFGGPQPLSWREILQRIADATGVRKRMLPVPALGVSTAATLLDRFDGFPVTREQMQMLMEGNCCASLDLSALGITPRALDASSLAYLARDPGESSRRQRDAA